MEAGVGPAEACVGAGALARLVSGVRKAVEERHLLAQAEGGQIGLVGGSNLTAALLTDTLDWILTLLFCLLGQGVWLQGCLRAGRRQRDEAQSEAVQ